MKTLIADRRFLALFLLISGIAWFFWTSSRYPALDSKAMMAGALNMQDGLSFDAWLAHRDGESWIEQVFVTFLNWVHTNRQGMGFGLLFAVVAMSIVPLIQRHIFFKPSGWNASFMGFIFGAPLGVCVNCAAPIAYGMYKNGARAELAIATMISSPTFNIVVVSMLISLFAWPLVAIKLGFTLVVIFILVPLLLKIFADEAYSTSTSSTGQAVLSPPIVDIDDSIPHYQWVLKALWKNAVFLLTRVIPIMLLAGLLGTLVVTLAPWEMLAGFNTINGYVLILVTLCLLSFFGLLVPVPIAFDIILAASLTSAGVPMKYVAALLFTLGTFSVYSFMILWKAGAKKVAVSLYLCLVAGGVFVGLASEYADEAYRNWEVTQFYSQLNSDDVTRHKVAAPAINSSVLSNAPAFSYRSVPAQPNVEQLELAINNTPSGPADFTMQVVNDAGFMLHERPLVELITETLALGAGLAAGDVNNDNWTDVLIGTANGLYLYMNTGGQFSPIALPFQKDIQSAIGAIGLQDFNNDGNLDIYYTEFKQGGFISYNLDGVFQEPQRIADKKPILNTAVAFGDLDQNGELDIVEAHHAGLAYLHKSDELSRNQLIMQNNKEFSATALPGAPGETLTMLLSDLNSDGWLDLMVGNDFDEPDTYYWGGANNTLSPWPDDSVKTTESTMSIDSADINNDLILESYQAQATRNPASPPVIIPERSIVDIHEEQCSDDSVLDSEARRRCRNLVVRSVTSWNRGARGCMELPENLKYDCLAARWYISGRVGNQPVDSTRLVKWYPDYADMYDHVYSYPSGKIDGVGMQQILDVNTLYQYTTTQGDTSVVDNAPELGVSVSGWSWNARFADLDGDQWQDLYVVNGMRTFVTDTSNVWFKNQGGSHFEQATEQAGLVDFEPTYSSLYVDIDNDSDLDLISFSANGKLKTFLNTESKNHHIQFELNDLVGNRRGIGSKITVHYADGQHQLREVKGSGGYLSQDSSIVHFGLGEITAIDRVDVQWSTGELSSFDGPFYPRNRYRLTRTD